MSKLDKKCPKNLNFQTKKRVDDKYDHSLLEFVTYQCKPGSSIELWTRLKFDVRAACKYLSKVNPRLLEVIARATSNWKPTDNFPILVKLRRCPRSTLDGIQFGSWIFQRLCWPYPCLFLVGKVERTIGKRWSRVEKTTFVVCAHLRIRVLLIRESITRNVRRIIYVGKSQRVKSDKEKNGIARRFNVYIFSAGATLCVQKCSPFNHVVPAMVNDFPEKCIMPVDIIVTQFWKKSQRKEAGLPYP